MSTLTAVERGRERARDIRAQLDLGTGPLGDVFALVEDVDPDVLVLARPLDDGPEGGLLQGAGKWLVVVNTHDRTRSRGPARQSRTCVLGRREGAPAAPRAGRAGEDHDQPGCPVEG